MTVWKSNNPSRSEAERVALPIIRVARPRCWGNGSFIRSQWQLNSTESTQVRRRQIWRLRFFMILLSLGLHGAVLWLPLPGLRTEKKSPPMRSVKVSRLLNRPPVEQSPVKPQPSPPVSPMPRAQASVSRSPRSSLPSTSSSIAAKDPVAQPVSPAPAPDSPFADFPQYPGAKPGSFGLFQGDVDRVSQQTPDGLKTVAAHFFQQLPTKGFKIQTQLDKSGQQIALQVSKAGVTQVLNLLHQPQGTVIILTDRVLDPASNPTVVLDDLVTILNQYLPAEASDFAHPERFYEQVGGIQKQEHADTEGGFRLVAETTPQALFANTLQSELQARRFEATLVGNYEGGVLYKVTQSNFKRYLSLIPNKDGTGTLMILWSKLPES